jgi:hypothetical protein
MPGRLSRFTLVLISGLIFCASAFTQTTPSQPQAARPKVTQPKVQHAEWTGQTQAYYGISQEDFGAMGLPKLTTDEYAKLFTWAYNRQTDVARTAKEEGKKEAIASEVTFSCGSKQGAGDAPNKIHVLIEDSPATASEVMSGVRQRLRGITDVEIVYELDQADLVVSILGYEDKMENGTRGIGYTASTVVTAPCVGKLGTVAWNFQMLDDHYLLSVGKDIGLLAEKIVTKIDSNNIEPIRRSRSQMKSLQNKKS